MLYVRIDATPMNSKYLYSNCTVNLGHTQVFYKAGQTNLTWEKCNPDDLTLFQPCYTHITNSGIARVLNSQLLVIAILYIPPGSH